MALVLAAIGARVVGVVAERLLDHGTAAEWTLRAKLFVQAGRGLATVCWLTLVGVFAWWCRVIVVADERHRVRRLLTVVPRLWRRRPMGAVVPHFLLALGGLLVGGAVLFAWRQSSAGFAGWALLWLAVLACAAGPATWRLQRPSRPTPDAVRSPPRAANSRGRALPPYPTAAKGRWDVP